MRMRDVLWQIWLNCGYFLTVAASGFFLYKLCAPFVRPRNGRFWRVLLFLTLAGSTGMVIWIGDPNLLYTLPAFFALFFLSTRGDRVGRLAAMHADLIFALGTHAERVVNGAITGGMAPEDVRAFDSMGELVEALKHRAKPGDVILFKGSRGMRMEQALEQFLKDQ